MAYATVEELRGQIGKSSADSDPILHSLLNAASDAIDKFCNRPLGFLADTTASARYYCGSGGTVQWIDECVSITTVSVKDAATDDTYTDWSATDWIACAGAPSNPDFDPISKGFPYTFIIVSAVGDYDHFTSGQFTTRRGFKPDLLTRRGVPTVKVTAKWGFATSVPATVEQACLIQAARWFKRAEASWSDTTGAPDLGRLMYTKSLDPDVEMLLVKTGMRRKVL